MKSQLKKTAVTACLALMSIVTFAQVRPTNNLPAPPDSAPGEMPPTPGLHKHGMERGPGLKVLTSLSGKVIAYQTNDRYIYNRFTLQNGSQVITVRFPEQLGKQLMSAAAKGKSVMVKGFTDNGPDGVNVFQMASLAVDGTQIADTPPSVPIAPVNEPSKTFTGKINDFKRDQSGAIRGLSLDNKVEIDLPPHAMEQLQSLLKAGDKVKVTGIKDTPPSGVLLESGAPTIIHPETIEINGQTYLLR
ncbi:hypothetical protein ACFE6N_16060 [Pedobacter sp. BG31]|uniref:hypothetical protein n=1 Tax=Pedobacter sp. BG31 TaxID=3349697 RepID=UPI0035F4F60A